MSQLTPRTYRLILSFSYAAYLSGCGDFSTDVERYSDLDRLRVLAVRSTPADLAPGETATLSALVFEPKGRDVSYEWSWCPARSDESGAFKCTISEKALRKAWADTGSSDELPSYDLGSGPEATFTHVFTPTLLTSVCESLSANAANPEQATLACLFGLEVSISLHVRSSKSEVTALKPLVLLNDNPAAAKRNVNPEPGSTLSVRDLTNNSRLKSGESVRAGHKYSLTAEVQTETAQTFTAAPTTTEPDPEPHRETLIMSWFMTEGTPVSADADAADSFGGDSERTTFVDGYNEFDGLVTNGWQLPLTAGPQDAQVIVVLRDERGGVGWSGQQFHVEEAK